MQAKKPRRFGEVQVISATHWDAKKIGEYQREVRLADYVFLDCGPAADAHQRAAIEASDFVIVAHDRQWGSRAAAREYAKGLKGAAKPYRVVYNKTRADGAQLERAGALAEASRQGIPEVAGVEAFLRRGDPGPLAAAADRIIDDLEHAGARVVGIVAGKGGVGKSTIALLLAVRLKQDGAKVIVLDLDNQSASLLKALRGDTDENGPGWTISDRRRKTS